MRYKTQNRVIFSDYTDREQIKYRPWNNVYKYSSGTFPYLNNLWMIRFMFYHYDIFLDRTSEDQALDEGSLYFCNPPNPCPLGFESMIEKTKLIK